MASVTGVATGLILGTEKRKTAYITFQGHLGESGFKHICLTLPPRKLDIHIHIEVLFGELGSKTLLCHVPLW